MPKPLGLPIGSVRAILAIGLVGSIIGAVFLGMLEAKELVPLATLALGFYFITRDGQTRATDRVGTLHDSGTADAPSVKPSDSVSDVLGTDTASRT